jgi:hypothetical protein
VDVIRDFIARINAGDVAGVIALLSPQHRFTDSEGAAISGRDALQSAWTAYFRMFPDYRIEPETWLQDGETVVVLGYAAGTYAPSGRLEPANSWRIPAAWRAVVRDTKVLAWQVYADVEPVRRIVERSGTNS